jgi:hypothetical protein
MSSRLRILERTKIQTKNQVNPVVVNCWMKNWNGGFVMCALHNEMNPHTPKKKNPICFGESSLLFLHHSLTYPLDSVNRANFWDPTKSLYLNPEWSTTRLVNHCPNATKWNCYIDCPNDLCAWPRGSICFKWPCAVYISYELGCLIIKGPPLSGFYLGPNFIKFPCVGYPFRKIDFPSGMSPHENYP